MTSSGPSRRPLVAPFDELFVISNLCLSANGASMAADHTKALGILIDEIAAQPSGRRVGLVLNGNTFDFTSDGEGSGAFEPGRSLHRINTLLNANVAALHILRRVVQRRDCRLVLVLGNREVDLVLPEVQARITAALCGDDALSRRRLILATDGNGLACTVGQANVLLLNGHEADPWNNIDYVKLYDHLEACRFARQWKPWWPSPGIRMRALWQRTVGRSHPWLLHMEDELLGVELLLTKDPKLMRIWARVPSIIWGMKRKEVSLRRVPKHARVLPPPRIRYADGDDPKPELDFFHDALSEWLPVLPSYFWTNLISFSQERRLERFGAALARSRYAKMWRNGTMELETVVRDDVHLVVTGHWRQPGVQRMKSQGLHVCCGFWEPGITIHREHACNPARFRDVCEALFSGSLARMDSIGDLLMPRYVTHVCTRTDGVFVQLRKHALQQRTFVGVNEMRLPPRP